MTCLPLVAGCQSLTSPISTDTVTKTVAASIQIPANIERLAVVYPRTMNSEMTHAYSWLEGATFQLKQVRPSLRIVDRLQQTFILDEQRLQARSPVAEETAVHIGGLIGVDSILLFHIASPTTRDRMFAALYGLQPEVAITSKIIRVETGEVVFHNVVTIRVDKAEAVALLVRAALDQALAQTVADLRHAFR